MKFIKMQGTGNDYVYVDCFSETVVDPAALAKQVSPRRFSIGSDGLILIQPADGYDGAMDMYNADGSQSEMCGNGLRCVAKLIHDRYARGKKELRLMTGAGEKQARIESVHADGSAATISLDMGMPILGGLDIPSTLDMPRVFEEQLTAGDRDFTFSSVSMGNPHCVIFVDDVALFPVEVYGPMIESHELFPNRVNVEFVQVVNKSELIQRTWERGSGETLACGTGASAVAVVARELGMIGDDVTIHLRGGDLDLHYDGSGTVRLTGDAVQVYSDS